MRERLRRPDHALGVFAFFERLRREATVRSRIAGPGQDGRPAYELLAFEDELLARATFRLHGESRAWWPDGLARVRCGSRVREFWLEIDGTERTPARTQPSKWRAKLDALCAYFASGAWRYRHSAFPAWLVVTTDPTNERVIRDQAEASARAFGVAVPEVGVFKRNSGFEATVLASCRDRRIPTRI